MSITATNPGGSDGEESACNVETSVWTLGWEDSPGGGHHSPLQYSCLGGPHGQGSLGGYSPCSCKEPDTTEWLNTTQPLTHSPNIQLQKIRVTHKILSTWQTFLCVCGNIVLYYVSCAQHYILSSVIQCISLPTKCLVLSSITWSIPFPNFVFPCPIPSGNHYSVLCICVFILFFNFYIPHMSEIIQYLSFFIWLI